MTVLIFHVTMTFWVGPSHPDSATYQVLGTVGLVNVEMKCFDLTRDHVIDVIDVIDVTLPVRSSHRKSPP